MDEINNVSFDFESCKYHCICVDIGNYCIRRISILLIAPILNFIYEPSMSKTRSTLTHLECGYCGKQYAAGQLINLCSECGKPLLAPYDLMEAAKTLAATASPAASRKAWRYEEVLPVQNGWAMLKLGEGWTPLHHARRLGEAVGCENTYIKDEGLNVTASFKARAGRGRQQRLGVGGRRTGDPRAPATPPAPAGAYAAAAGLPHASCAWDVPSLFRSGAASLGAHVNLVDGLINDCGVKCCEGVAQYGWFERQHPARAVSHRGQEDDGLRDRRAVGLDAAGS